ncbi:MAG TPA: hypothetical protein VIY54_00755 [Steroidobacteraceae bacterium]
MLLGRMLCLHRLLYVLILSYAALVPVAMGAERTCKVIDLMPEFWRSLASADSAARMRATLIDRYPQLYNEQYVSVPAGAKWAELLARDRTYSEAHRTEVDLAEHYLQKNVTPIMQNFARWFADYRCDFTFYIAPSFGRMDGSAAFIQGEHRIIFAPDVIPRYHRVADLKVLIDHETFHVYHHQVTGTYGASAAAVPTILQALWSEGLATFVSWRMNPGVSLDTALLQPGIPAGARPHLPEIARALLARLDDADEPLYARYFEAGKQPAGYPPRAGYYVGVLIVQALSSRYTLAQLAHLHGPALRAEVVARLEKMAGHRRGGPPL